MHPWCAYPGTSVIHDYQTAVDRLDEEFGLSASELRFMEALLLHSGLAYLPYSSTRLRARLS